MSKKFANLWLCLLGALIFTTGCGSSNDEVITPPPPAPTSSIEARFDRAPVVAQSFDTATHYTVDVLNAGTDTFIRPADVFQANNTVTRQVHVMTSIPVGTYDVVVTGFNGDPRSATDNVIQLGQRRASSAPTDQGATRIVGAETNFPLVDIPTGTYTPNLP